MNSVDLVLVGLSSDIVGAVVLAKGFMLKRPSEAWRESRTFSGGNGQMLKSALLQKAEAWVGMLFLVGGFLLQLGGTWGRTEVNQNWINTWPRLLLLFTLMGLAGWIATLLARRQAKRSVAGLYAEVNQPPKH